MIPQVLTFITTYKCNFFCDHCSVYAGPERQEVLAADVMQWFIEQAYALPSIRSGKKRGNLYAVGGRKIGLPA